jgi:hypothetical protein
MTTIFIQNLKLLVLGELKHRWGKLDSQLTKYDFGALKLSKFVHNEVLSATQATIISELQTEIEIFEATGDDSADKDAIKGLIKAAKTNILEARKDEPSGGSTLRCLEGLFVTIDNFHSTLKDFNFQLLNRTLINTPEFVVYSHACYYIGLFVFHPDPSSNVQIRARKETELLNMLNLIRKATRPEDTLAIQKETALQVLTNLARANNEIVQPKKVGSLSASYVGLSFLGLRVKKPTASLGSLERLIELATKKINALEIDTADCPKLMKVAAEGVEEESERNSSLSL